MNYEPVMGEMNCRVKLSRPDAPMKTMKQADVIIPPDSARIVTYGMQTK